MRINFCFYLFIFLSIIHFPSYGELQNTRIRAIVFDFSGVIAKEDKQEVATFIARTFNVPIYEGVTAQEKLKEYLYQGGNERNFWLLYARSTDKPLPEHWLEKLDQVKLNALKEIPGMVNLVKNLQRQGYQTVLLSNVSINQARIKRQSGYYNLFQPIFLSYQVGLRKPDPKIYQMLLERLHMNPQMVLFIDNKSTNIEAAKSLCIDSIQFITNGQLIKELRKRGIDIH